MHLITAPGRKYLRLTMCLHLEFHFLFLPLKRHICHCIVHPKWRLRVWVDTHRCQRLLRRLFSQCFLRVSGRKTSVALMPLLSHLTVLKYTTVCEGLLSLIYCCGAAEYNHTLSLWQRLLAAEDSDIKRPCSLQVKRNEFKCSLQNNKQYLL